MVTIFTKTTELHRRLIAHRHPGLSVDPLLPQGAPEVVRDHRHWVTCWIDRHQTVNSADGTSTASRAITDRGEMIWVVRRSGQPRIYHSPKVAPFEALADAHKALTEWHRVKLLWSEVRKLRRQVLSGAMNFHLTAEDVYRSALSPVSVQSCLRWFGMTHRASLSARNTALLSYLDEDALFCLWTAFERARPMRAQPAGPPGFGLHIRS